MFTRPTRPAYREYRVTVENEYGGRTNSRNSNPANPFYSFSEARMEQRRANNKTARIEYRDSPVAEWFRIDTVHNGECGAACTPDSCPYLRAYVRGEGEYNHYLSWLAAGCPELDENGNPVSEAATPIETAVDTADKIIAADGDIPAFRYRLMPSYVKPNGERYEWSFVGVYDGQTATDMIWSTLGRESYAPNGERVTITQVRMIDESGRASSVWKSGE
jgi:hypothetical protein